MERVPYLDFPNCVRLANDEIEVIATTDVGPRIVRYAFHGGPNVLGEFPELGQGTEWGEWKPYGGHRLWVAPEAMPQSYAPDGTPIEARGEGKLTIRLVQPTDRAGFGKEMTIAIAPSGAQVEIHHRITNRNPVAVDAAPWALTVVRGGMALLPLEPHREHGDALLPAQPLVLWPFTDLTDARLKFGRKTVRVIADETANTPLKIGLGNKRGWLAYHKETTLFVKSFRYQEGARYPDYGANAEVFVKGAYLELESLGALERLEPGASLEHTERWTLYPNVGVNELERRLQETGGA